MSSRYIRTSAGQSEIQTRTRNLSRPVRNLLLIINASCTIDYWLEKVQGITAQDVALLRSEGLIIEDHEAANAQETSPAAPVAPRDFQETTFAASPDFALPLHVEDDWSRAKSVIRVASYNALYEALNSVGRSKLGLMRGYRFALEVEQCSGREELSAFALKFARLLRAEHGMAAVGYLTYAIGAVQT